MRRVLLLAICAASTWIPIHAQQRDLRLIDAIKRRDEKAFAALMRAKVDVNATQPDGATALAWAVHLGERRMAEALLDHSLVLFGSSISESNIHTHDDLPIVLAGGANRQLKGNRHLVYQKETPLNNLLLNMFDFAGIPHVEGFGDSTGRLTDV